MALSASRARIVSAIPSTRTYATPASAAALLPTDWASKRAATEESDADCTRLMAARFTSACEPFSRKW